MGDPTSSNNGLFYLYSDHLGSNSVMSYYKLDDGSNHSQIGQAVPGSRARYLPFGGWRTEPTASLTDMGFTSHRANNAGSGDIGLIYMNARYYSPGISRFISADTIVPNSQNPQSFNRYSYTYNNPVKYTDPTGHDVDCIIGETACSTQVEVENLWDENYVGLVGNRQDAEQAFIHFLNDPMYFIQLYTDPQAWADSMEVANLEVYLQYSDFHTTAGHVVENLVYDAFGMEVSDALARVSIQRSMGHDDSELEGDIGILAAAGIVTRGGGAFTEPTLPSRVIVSENGVLIEHYYRSNDHGPAHAHVYG